MLPAVEILIERAKSHPEEFYHHRYDERWRDILNYYEGCLTDDEKEPLRTALKEAERTMFTQAVMEKLAGKDNDDDENGGGLNFTLARMKKNYNHTFGRTMNEILRKHVEEHQAIEETK
jgi:hypothetical protein